MSTITRIDVHPVHIPLTATFKFASGSAGAAGEGAPHVFVKVTDDAGRIGWGEGRPVPSWSYETLASVTTTLRDHLGPAIIGMRVTDTVALHRRMHAAVGRGPSPGQPIAKAAIDMACHDLLARTLELPLRELLGGSREQRDVQLSYTVTAHDAAGAREQVEAAQAEGFVHFNFKAAVDPSSDAEVARTLREMTSDGGFVWADANQGYALHAARQAARTFADLGVDVLEQPLPADRRHLLKELRRLAPIALAVDESSVGPADFFAHVAEGLVDYLVVKVTRSGGIAPTMQQVAVAEAAGLPMLVSGLTESLLAKLAACQVAAARGCTGPAALNGSQFLDESAIFPDKTSVENNGTVTLNNEPGIGVAPDEGGLARWRVDVQ